MCSVREVLGERPAGTGDGMSATGKVRPVTENQREPIAGIRRAARRRERAEQTRREATADLLPPHPAPRRPSSHAAPGVAQPQEYDQQHEYNHEDHDHDAHGAERPDGMPEPRAALLSGELGIRFAPPTLWGDWSSSRFTDQLLVRPGIRCQRTSRSR